ncbi:hypothetical protein MAPG_11123 [Magnaporthiopsis poae ATCC 64411]|uniref:Uncharacterized protein n=1 Tax=Magnaporthiopsis poae (strain ATCC 64411 / 73-15) TaxID=644358 RepID=A0A0C4EEF0_MAGP6|nr:hypothetical protein MAPG_11123 [Magnaporthiopsis poae ATCC 64411]
MCRASLLVGATDERQISVAGLSVVVAAPRSSAVISVGPGSVTTDGYAAAVAVLGGAWPALRAENLRPGAQDAPPPLLALDLQLGYVR